MGFDIYGVKNRDAYFRNNVWWWHPLWDYCCDVAPKITAKVKYAHTNDGDGLGVRDSKKLADILTEEISSGRTALYALRRELYIKGLKDDPCESCKGTGKEDAVGENPCNVCNGKGSHRPWAANYPFSVKNVKEFATFLKTCGGFTIC